MKCDPVQENWGLHLSLNQALLQHPVEARKAIHQELQAMLDMSVWDPVDPTDVTKEIRMSAIPCSVFVKDKFRPDNSFEKTKARCVGGGHRQPPVPAEETYSPTIPHEAVTAALAVAALHDCDIVVADAPSAYLNASLREAQFMFLSPQLAKIFLEIAPHYRKYVMKDGRIMVKLVKALYGLKQSALLWYLHLKGKLELQGYTPSDADKCLFTKRINGKVVSYALVHVDDILLISSSTALRKRLVSHLTSCYGEMKVQEGDSLSYCGMRITRNRPLRSIKLDCSAFTKKFLSEAGVTGQAATPAGANFLDNPPSEPADIAVFKSQVMSLLYLAKKTRPDILFSVSHLATRISEPTIIDMKKLERIKAYLNGTADLGIILNSNSLSIQCYSDASYATHSDAKSHTGVSVSVGGSGAILSKSAKQKIVTRSSTEAELVALDEGVECSLRISNIFKSIGHDVTPVIVYQDNKSTIELASRGEAASKRSKHIAVRYFSVKQHMDAKQILIEYKPTEDMIADVLTKPLQGEAFVKLRRLLLNLSQ